MISFRTACIFLLGLFVLTSCASESSYDEGQKLYDQGRYAEAVQYYTRAIQNPQGNNDLFLSYYWRGEANMKEGKAENAFHDYYAANIVSCYLEKYETRSRGYASGMIPSSYCRQFGDQKMASVSSDIPQEEQAVLKQKAETALSRFLE